MHQPTHIKVLKGLPLALMGARQYKEYELLCWLQAVFTCGRFRREEIEFSTLAAWMLVHPRTISRQLERCIKAGVIEIREGVYYLPSWDQLAEQFKIRHVRHYHIKPSKYVKLEYILRDKSEDEKKKQCAKACCIRIESNRYLKEAIETVAGTVYADSVATHQLNCFKQKGRGYDDDQRYALSTYYSSKEQQIIRGDVQLCYRTLNRLFGYKGHSVYGYWKRKLERLGLRVNEHRVEELQAKGLHTNTADRMTRQGFVKWLKDERRLVLIMPDRVTHLPLSSLDFRFEKLQTLLNGLQEGQAIAA